jgi:hypothetical protein
MVKTLLAEIQVSCHLSQSTKTNTPGYKHLRAKTTTDEMLLWEA